MKIYINQKQIFILLLPIIFWILFYFSKDYYQDDIFNYFKQEKKDDLKIEQEIAKDYFLLNRELIKYENLKKEDYDQSDILKTILKPKTLNTFKNYKKIEKKWRLKFTIITKNKKIAYLNGKIVHIGDKVFDAKILDIRKNRVKIKTDEGVKWISILE
ncbi:hypothetical protein [Nitrosophilus kaiyonis]|uniref:hypothetical protein n=1 Tax=Nitrosophilus kaiyonis TaxID=2930200 RepID=UPI00249198AB|nr:hypothetical protein [Nitrosophilus kaiyonis]